VIDYDETFTLVAQMTTVHTLLAVTAVRHCPLYQMDVKNVSLHVTEDVYMKAPPGFTTPPGHVCHLRHAIYGLKHAPRAWFERFQQALTSFGFQQSTVAGFQDSLHDHHMMVSRRGFRITLCLCEPRRRAVFFYCRTLMI